MANLMQLTGVLLAPEAVSLFCIIVTVVADHQTVELPKPASE